ncbi:hypothetical protein ACFQ3W_01470 [Paenibacillus puldeungensis]|uniref:Uncharacterized protein n=1 Tax=Paenibacillus puldeungensis TaxID=696536 RepID=A0ABW3RRT7_9BACL
MEIKQFFSEDKAPIQWAAVLAFLFHNQEPFTRVNLPGAYPGGDLFGDLLATWLTLCMHLTDT